MRFLLFLLTFLTLLHSATLFGEIYDGDSFAHLNNTRIRIDGPATMQFIAQQNYSVELPLGNYSLSASYFKDGKLEYYIEEKINLNQESMHFDLVLLPYELQKLKPNENDTVVTPPGQPPQPPPAPPQTNNLLLALTGVVALIVIYLVYKKLSEKKETKKEEVSEETEEVQFEEEYALDDDSRKILEILKSSGGRMLQKELREVMGASQSNMSLILTELEHLGYIKRFKRGRENLLKLVKEPPSS